MRLAFLCTGGGITPSRYRTLTVHPKRFQLLRLLFPSKLPQVIAVVTPSKERNLLEPLEIYLSAEEQTELTCNVEGAPVPEFRW